MTDHAQDNVPGRDGFLYWELPADELERLRQCNGILEDEGYLAHDMNWGRRLLDLRADSTSVPDVAGDWAGPPSNEHVSDAISRSFRWRSASDSTRNSCVRQRCSPTEAYGGAQPNP